MPFKFVIRELEWIPCYYFIPNIPLLSSSFCFFVFLKVPWNQKYNTYHLYERGKCSSMGCVSYFFRSCYTCCTDGMCLWQRIDLSKCHQIVFEFEFDQYILRSSISITIFGTSCSWNPHIIQFYTSIYFLF